MVCLGCLGWGWIWIQWITSFENRQAGEIASTMTIDAMLVTVADNISVHLSIPGEPVSQPRHRVRRLFSSGSGRVLFCDPAATQKREVKASIRSALVGVGVVDFPVVQQRQVKVTADFHVADARKDIDNLLKFIVDAIKSVATVWSK